MNLRWRISIYGSLVLAIVSLILLYQLRDNSWLFFACEVALVTLAIFGFKLLFDIFKPLELLLDTTRRLSEQEFTTRLAPLGHPETDRLVEVYNRMAEILRQQRIHNREQEYFLKKILQTTTSAILIFDFEARIDQVNPIAQVFLDMPEEALLGKTLEDLSSPLAQRLSQLPLHQSTVIPFRGQRRLKCTRSSFLDRGFYKHYIFMDELTAELRQTEKDAYEKLIRVMSHEINNSLGAANSLLHSCLTYAPQINEADRADFKTALEVVISRTDHLKSFVSDYVSVIKLPPPKRQPTQISVLLDHVQLVLSAEFKRRKIRWSCKLEEDYPVDLDRLQMEQVLLNIVKNAMEAIDYDGAIWVRYIRRNHRPALLIEDSGKGIPEETEAHLFTPFYTTKASGLGIGLTFVAEVLNNHGFTFALESIPGEATCFTIWF